MGNSPIKSSVMLYRPNSRWRAVLPPYTSLGPIQWEDCNSSLNYTIPVSYTHLDVYKRQILTKCGTG